jgi:hypothetical protein
MRWVALIFITSCTLTFAHSISLRAAQRCERVACPHDAAAVELRDGRCACP